MNMETEYEIVQCRVPKGILRSDEMLEIRRPNLGEDFVGSKDGFGLGEDKRARVTCTRNDLVLHIACIIKTGKHVM